MRAPSMQHLQTRFTPFSANMFRTAAAVSLMLCLPGANAFAARNRISGRIENSRRFTLRGNMHPKAQADYDQGAADASLVLPYVTLVLKQSPAQEADLTQ